MKLIQWNKCECCGIHSKKVGKLVYAIDQKENGFEIEIFKAKGDFVPVFSEVFPTLAKAKSAASKFEKGTIK